MSFELYQPTSAEMATLTVADFYQKNKEKFKNDILMEGTLVIESYNKSNKFETPAFIIKSGYVVMEDMDMTYELYMSSLPPKIYITTGKDNFEYPTFPYDQNNRYVTLALHPDVVYDTEVESRLAEMKNNRAPEILKEFNYPDPELKNISITNISKNFSKEPVISQVEIEQINKNIIEETAQQEMLAALTDQKMVLVETSSGEEKFKLVDKVIKELNLEPAEIELDNSFKGSSKELSSMLKKDFAPGQLVLVDAMPANKQSLMKFLEATEELGIQLIMINHFKNGHKNLTVTSFDNVSDMISSYNNPLVSKTQSLENIQDMKSKAENNTNKNKPS